MSRLSLHDRKGDSVERKLPVCRMCCKLFASASTNGEVGEDRRLAAFRPCGHVFHYSCIMERYQRMEDACNCVTCFSRIEDLPMVLFMEWSKSTRPLSQKVCEEIEILTAPDEESLGLRDELDMLKHKLDSIRAQKSEVIRKLNIVNDATAIAKAECEGLDEVCELMAERLRSFVENQKKETRACDELSLRIKRDSNRAVIGELLILIETGGTVESKLTETAYAYLSKSADPDDLLAKLSALYENFRKRVKDETKSLVQLKTTVHSVKKDAEDAQQRLLAAERAQLVKKVVSKNTNSVKKVVGPPVVDRRVIAHPRQPNRTGGEDQDDLMLSGKRQKNSSNFSHLFS